MARNKALTFNDICEMEARGDTCPELEEVNRQMASIAEKLDFVAPQFEKISMANNPAFIKIVKELETQNSRLSGIVGSAANSPEFSNVIDQIESSSVHKLSKQLEALNLGASASIAKLTENLSLPGFTGIRDSLADLEKRTSSQLVNRPHDYFNDGNLFKTAAKQSAAALFAAPHIPEMDFVPAIQEITSVHTAIAEATRKQSQAMKNEFHLLITQMEIQAKNSEELVNIAVATAEGNISSIKRNNRQFKITLFIMTLGAIPAIVSGVAQLMPFVHRIQIVHWFQRLR
jgi:hypothetical protein